MRRRLIIIYVLLVVGPLALLAKMGTMWARLEQERLRNRFRELLTNNLRETDETISRLIQAKRRQFIELTRRAPADLRELENLVEKNPWIRQAFLVAADGRLLYPSRDTQSPAEIDFIERTREIWWRRDLPPFDAKLNQQIAGNQAAVSNNVLL
ncbi:hypothetical protein LLG95_10530, partial [bacterium]|nr:hypothetical protein [bacterium]